MTEVKITARFSPVWRVNIDDAVAKRIVTAYAEDRPIAEITSRFDISTRTLYRLLDVEGVPLRAQGRGPTRQAPLPETEIIEAYLAEPKERCADIAARFEIGKDTLYGVLRRNGVPMRRG